jgi:ABC-type multidrug transport system fused ATPase/permease subunit
MLDGFKKKLFSDPYSAPSMIRRLLKEHALGHWRAYVFVLVMMAIMAASTAGVAYLIGHAVNESYVSRNFAAVIGVCTAIIIVATFKGLATYFQAVELARISNRIVAENQRQIFERSCSRARHSSPTGTRRSSQRGSPGARDRHPIRSILSLPVSAEI